MGEVSMRAPDEQCGARDLADAAPEIAPRSREDLLERTKVRAPDEAVGRLAEEPADAVGIDLVAIPGRGRADVALGLRRIGEPNGPRRREPARALATLGLERRPGVDD